ncbi:LacI family DNA-binding transcriptional regulator [Rhizobium sp. 2YAF20]|uniref:LacI family DNA-binding transcriptional regulator n=1 Tax=Rhizobium sp. 2YAF20 TaxID=3233027 RepID=UPI003F97DE76
MRSQTATMADVAREAQVSPTTAARVIHNRGYVSDENRRRVLEAVESTGYRPNLQARSLRMQRSYSLGLVLSSARENPFYTHISHAIRTAASDRGFSMLTVNHSYSPEAEVNGIKQFLEHGVDATILCHALENKNVQPLIQAGIPVIQVERHDIEQAYFVAIDPEPGMRAAVKSLADEGHRRVAFIGARATGLKDGGPGHAEQRRAEAFQQAVSLYGLDEQDCPVVLGEYFPRSPNDMLPGRRLATMLLDDHGCAVTAIIAGSDILAAGILQVLYERGLNVPSDISVIGYDDSMAQFLSPALSSIAQPYRAIGDSVMEFVEEAVGQDTGSAKIRERSVSTSLVLRNSIGPAPGSF